MWKLSIYIASEICNTIRDTSQAHRPPRALRFKTDTACGTNEFEYLTFWPLVLSSCHYAQSVDCLTLASKGVLCRAVCVQDVVQFVSHSSIVQCVEMGPAHHTTCLPGYLVQHSFVSFARAPTPG